MRDQSRAEVGPGDFPERVHSKEEVEGPQRIHEFDAGEILAEARHDEVAPFAEFAHHAVYVLLHALIAQCRGRGELRGVVRAGGGMRLQGRHRFRDLRRCEREPNAPPRHRVRLADAVDHDHAFEQIVGKIEKRRRGPGSVVNAPIDLIGDHPDFLCFGPLRDRTNFRVRIDGARWIAGRAHDQARRAREHALQVVHARLETPLRVARNHHRSRAREMDDLRVGHPRGRRNRDDIARPEQRETGVEQRLLGAVRDDDVIGVDRPAAREEGEVRRGRRSQLQNAVVGRIVGLALLDRANAGLGGYRRRREIGLARSHIDDILARGLAALCLGGNRDRGGRLEVLQVGRQTLSHGEWLRSAAGS